MSDEDHRPSAVPPRHRLRARLIQAMEVADYAADVAIGLARMADRADLYALTRECRSLAANARRAARAARRTLG